MLTDAILCEATAEAERFLLTVVPVQTEPHTFSRRFQRKMSKLIHRTNHPIRYKVLRSVAVVVLAIATLFGAVMAVSPEARAAVVGWVKETLGIYTHYSNENAHTAGNSQEETEPDYQLTKIPDGYRKWKVRNKATGKSYSYINDKGTILYFTYAHGGKNANLFIETENCEQYSGLVNGMHADIYISREANETSVIVWVDKEADVLFCILAMADQEGLIEIAQSVRQKN